MTYYERDYTIEQLIAMNGEEPCGRDTTTEEVEEVDFFTGEPIR